MAHTINLPNEYGIPEQVPWPKPPKVLDNTKNEP